MGLAWRRGAWRVGGGLMIVAQRTSYRPRFLSPVRRGFRGLGAVSQSQLSNPTPGKQPSFIQGSYGDLGQGPPTWSDLNVLPGYSLYNPYSQSQINGNLLSAGPMIAKNQCVLDQYSRLYAGLFPEIYGQPSGSAMDSNCGFSLPTYAPVSYPMSGSAATCRNASGAVVPCTNNAPLAAPLPVSVPIQVGKPQPVLTGIAPVQATVPVVPTAAPMTGAEPAYFTSGGSTAAAASSFSLSGIPWWGWGLAGLAAIWALSSK